MISLKKSRHLPLCPSCREHLSLPSSEPKTITSMMRTTINATTVAITPLLTNLPCAAAFVLHSGPCILNESALRGFSSWLFAFIANFPGPAEPATNKIKFSNDASRDFVLYSALYCYIWMQIASDEIPRGHWNIVKLDSGNEVLQVSSKSYKNNWAKVNKLTEHSLT